MRIEILEINAQSPEGLPAIFTPTLVKFTDKTNYLIDCGFTYNYPEFKQELEKFGVSIADLTGIIISHDDIDHLEGLHCFKEENAAIKVISSDAEADSVAGVIPAERLVQVEGSLNFIPQEMKPMMEGFVKELKAIKRFPVDSVLKDKEVINDTLVVVATPGHTKGHISFYDTASKTVIAADAIVVEEGEFNIANPQFTLDMDAALASVERIKSLQPTRIICYHGGIVEDDIQDKLQRLLDRYKQ
ncbi:MULTISPECIES: MBL fold metallo-hydrolase [Myroides]|uniref:MBL fold metallo-hydrolase n=1 Tax=Myroides TaxID=76831 RepID=UPI0013033676|nr:MBL fold metallo-hydrolase [Myroides phaeus]